ncbi:MAG: hypothetical protein HON14_14630 [Rhodospirillaceae bacterium]|mgnify:FL=1|jgi:hypothetical protein|nr:hypothetical protein [Rhodospirillaceae bacterium]MBT4589346.1 hypothetical protein [Rhodospirillaceae bacterium]MBT4940367.1 hypothetical protein [Rhodospirillaceae bacterium]MBT5938463.1 hypothetical protein [Rhodospirillaceae bacterium]MBT7266899.1 hypothetical protein [Rhodospirillaceae bacterium]
MFFGRRKRFIKLTAKSLDRHIADFTKSMAKDFDEFIKHLKEENIEYEIVERKVKVTWKVEYLQLFLFTAVYENQNWILTISGLDAIARLAIISTGTPPREFSVYYLTDISPSIMKAQARLTKAIIKELVKYDRFHLGHEKTE